MTRASQYGAPCRIIGISSQSSTIRSFILREQVLSVQTLRAPYSKSSSGAGRHVDPPTTWRFPVLNLCTQNPHYPHNYPARWVSAYCAHCALRVFLDFSRTHNVRSSVADTRPVRAAAEPPEPRPEVIGGRSKHPSLTGCIEETDPAIIAEVADKCRNGLSEGWDWRQPIKFLAPSLSNNLAVTKTQIPNPGLCYLYYLLLPLLPPLFVYIYFLENY